MKTTTLFLLVLGVFPFGNFGGFVSNEDNSPNLDVDYDDFLPENPSANSTYKLIKGLMDATGSIGGSVQFQCTIEILNPNLTEDDISVKWFRGLDGLRSTKTLKILRKKESSRTRKLLSSTLRLGDLTKEDGGTYECSFNRRGIPPIGAKADLNIADSNMESMDQMGVEEGSELKRRPEEPFCQRYSGSTCELYLGNRYVFVQPPHTQKGIEENLKAAYLVVSQSTDISVECSKFVLPSLCYSAFPLCKNTEMVHLYQQKVLATNSATLTGNDSVEALKIVRNQLTVYLRRICRDECVILETELCNREYAIAKRHPIISKVLDLEECERLPAVEERPSVEKGEVGCLELGIDGRIVDKEESCFWGDGSDYRGVHEVTVSGMRCKRWANQFQVPLPKHPELLGHNYCRNPGRLEKEPFCYVDQTVREPCGIKRCANLIAIYSVVVLGLVSITVAALTWTFCFRRRNKTRNIQNISIPSADKNIYGNGGPNSPIELNTLLLPQSSSNRTKTNFQNVPNYTYKEVTFVQELGEGAFGKVYKGELKTKTSKLFVAVKSLKENASAKTQADFQREIELISELKHPNIICLLGIIIKQEPFCMLFEYMSEGDLHEFLISNSSKGLSQNEFLSISLQIAQGMEYLSDNHYVHRDLAARNCLVSEELVVKISDFGLSRDMYSCDYYRVQSKSLLPVRWMPPESILYGKFTTESDVWSYGVVLWEIYSYGLQPYYGYNNQEVIGMIRSRKLLPCPESCPSYIYSLMVECWAELSVRRPSFGEIGHRLRVWKNQQSKYEIPPQKAPKSETPSCCTSASPPNGSNLLCPTFENQKDPSLTWERNIKMQMAAGSAEAAKKCRTLPKGGALCRENELT